MPRGRALSTNTKAAILSSGMVVTMSIVYFTLVAIILYFAADWILDRVEIAAGKRLEHRSLIFFVILLTLALTSFSLIQSYTGVS